MESVEEEEMEEEGGIGRKREGNGRSEKEGE